MMAIRSLKPSETPPTGEPRRYKNLDGYTRLRWKIGPREYVEMYERDENGQLVRDRPDQRKLIDAASAIALYEAGWTLPQVGAALGCDHGSLSRLLKRNGIKARRSGDYSPVALNSEYIRGRYVDDGISPHDIAMETGADATRIRSELRRLGVLRKPGRPIKKRSRKGLVYETEFKRMRPHVMERAAGRCEIRADENCAGVAVVVHHRRIRSQGGANSLENLYACCRYCHQFAHMHPKLAYERGWMLRGVYEPEARPA